MRKKKVWIIGIGSLVLAALFWLRPHKDSAATKGQEVAAKSEEIAQESAKEAKPRKMNRASETDWAAVNVIAAEYKPQLAGLERQWTELKTNKCYKPNSGSRNPEIQKKYSAASKAVWNTEKAIRALEREQWAQMEAYLSPYELRKYRMEHSLCGRLLRQETNWMEPPLSEGEFLSLFIRREGELDFLDEHFTGDYRERGAMFRRAQDKMRKLQEEIRQQPPWSRKDAKAGFAEQAENDPDCRLYWEYSRIGRGAVPLSTERAMQVAWGPGNEERAMAELRLMESFDLRASGQITAQELSLAKERHILEMQLADGYITKVEMEAELERLRKEQAQEPIQWERNQEAVELPNSMQDAPASRNEAGDE